MSDAPLIDEGLLPFASVLQRAYLNAVNEHGGYRAAARALNVASHTQIVRSIQALKGRAAIKGYAPEHDMTHAVPSPFVVKGTSTYYNDEGKPTQQWVKTRLDGAVAEQVIRDFVESLVQDVRGLAPLAVAPDYTDADLLAAYVMGDPHFGMYAWAAETGDDFDLDTAEALTCAAIDRLVASAPPAETGLLLNLGDFFHADNSSNQTPGNGNPLDVDTRYAKVMQVGLRAMVHCIKRLRERHARVVVWNLPGNHDPHSSFALALCLDAFFNNDERVFVDLSPGLYKYLRHGKTLIGAHHGHGAKMEQLPGIMACDQPQAWGLTEFRYFLMGHIHHKSAVKEHPGCLVESFNTLAARDAWHAGKGYRSQRNMQCIAYHTEFGEVERHTVPTAMLERRAA